MANSEKLEEAFAYAATKLGIPALNEHQKAAVEAIVGGKDAFVCLPTGSGRVPFAKDHLAFFRLYLSRSKAQFLQMNSDSLSLRTATAAQPAFPALP